MNRMFSTSTCLPVSEESKAYLDEYLTFYCKLGRDVFQKLKHGVLDDISRASFVTRTCKQHGVLKRTVNSIIFDMQGKIKAYRELKNTELQELLQKITAVEGRIESEQKTVDEMKPHAASNSLTEKELQQYRKAKESLYHLKNKLNKLKQKRDALEKHIEENGVSICFGTKSLFSKQYRLEENGFRSHKKWHNVFVRKRDSGIFLLGCGGESFGNQILQLQFNEKENEFKMVLLKDLPFRKEASKKFKDRTIVLEHVKFPYLQAELQKAIQDHKPITYKISKKRNRWYLTATFEMDVPLETFRTVGAFGVDYNDGFLEVVETDYCGNMVGAHHIPLKFHGTGAKAETELKEKLSKLVRLARSEFKDIVVEDLNFTKKKAKVLPGKKKRGKQYNKMIHAFDYSRYLFWMENLCIKYGVGFNKVNPAYTSKIGKAKYAGPKKLTVHRAAAFVIARRGQDFKDKCPSKKREPAQGCNENTATATEAQNRAKTKKRTAA